VDIDPAHAEAQFYLAKTLDRTGRLERAISVYQRAGDLIPNNAAIRYNLANIYFRLAEVDRARQLFRWAVALDPSFAQNPPYRLNGAIDRPDAAQGMLALLQQRVQQAPEDARRWLHLGLAFELRGQMELAAAQYRQALERDPDQVEALAHLAAALATLAGRSSASPGESEEVSRSQAGTTVASDEIIGLAARACELTEREDPYRLDTLAAAYAHAGDSRRALATGREALALAERIGPSTLIKQIRQRLAAYRASPLGRTGE
jgi:tetratricopeptide (TPR) repeat protein